MMYTGNGDSGLCLCKLVWLDFASSDCSFALRTPGDSIHPFSSYSLHALPLNHPIALGLSPSWLAQDQTPLGSVPTESFLEVKGKGPSTLH